MLRAEKDSGLAETPVSSRVGSCSGAPSTSGQMGWQAMRKTYALSKLAAAAVTMGGLFLPFASATTKERPVVVTAPEASSLVVRRVSYADLDLALPDGRTALHHRVGYAVSDVCAEANLFDNGSSKRACCNARTLPGAARARRSPARSSAPPTSRPEVGRPLQQRRSASASAARRRARAWLSVWEPRQTSAL